MTKDEALKLALEALEANQPVNYCVNNNGERFPMMQEDPFRFERNTKAITAIKEALAKPEQELVAWMYEQARFGPTDLRGQQWKLALSRLKPWAGDGLVRNVRPLYTTPPQRKPWVGLTDEEQIQVAWACGAMSADWLEFAQAIEAKLKEKNHG